VALNKELMQPDGIHPNAVAQPKLLDNAWPVIEKEIEATLPPARRAGGAAGTVK
jgi:acyl-CoA thioesterase-1